MINKKLLLIGIIFLMIPFTFGLNSNWENALPEYISVYLDTNGNQTGTENAIGNYASGQKFYIEPESDEVIRLARLILTIGDTAIDNADEYGSIAAVSNGVSFWLENNGTRRRIDGNESITNNGQYLKLMYDFNCDLSSIANGVDYCAGRWTFQTSGTLLRLDGATNDKFIVQLNDSFVGLAEHYFLVQGYYETTQNTTSEVINMLSMAFILVFVLCIYFVLAINWDFALFDAREDNKNNAMKGLLAWLGFWLIPLIIQFGVLVGDNYGATANMITLFNTMYEVSIWVAYVISVYFMVFFGYNVMLWLGNVTKSRK